MYTLCGFTRGGEGKVVETKRRHVLEPAPHKMAKRQRTNAFLIGNDGGNPLGGAIVKAAAPP